MNSFFGIKYNTLIDYAIGALLSLSVLRQPFYVICSYLFIDGTRYVYPLYSLLMVVVLLSIISKRCFIPRSFYYSVPIILVVIGTCFIGDKEKYVSGNLTAILIFYVVPFFSIQYITNRDSIKKIIDIFLILYYILGSIVFFLFHSTSRYYGADAMVATYAIGLPASCYLYKSFQSNSRWGVINLVLALCGVLMSLLAGSRGVLSLYFFALFLGLNHIRYQGTIIRILLILAIFVFFFNDTVVDLFLGSRFIDVASDGLFEDKSRTYQYYIPALNAFLDSPLWGWGTFGDRMFTYDNKWSHNLFIEILCDYGILFGVPFLIWLIINTYKFTVKQGRDIFCLLFLLAIPQLLISSSFLLLSNLWLYVGLILAENNNVYYNENS